MGQKILISGASGLIGRALLRDYIRKNAQITVLVRRPAQPISKSGVVEVEWNPEKPLPAANLSALEGCTAAVHLSGASVARRWTPSFQQQILNSRIDTADALGRIFSALAAPPPVLVAASAVGYYGDRGDELLTEDAGPGRGFLSEVCQAWEASTAGLAPRVAQMRFGVVLSARGGALCRMLPIFRRGFGGRLGSGRQWMSWVSLQDAVAAIDFVIANSSLFGVFNTCAPVPVTNAEFTQALGRAVRRPAVLPVPAIALRFLFGQMARETLLASTRVLPRRLRNAGFLFSHERIDEALRDIL